MLVRHHRVLRVRLISLLVSLAAAAALDAVPALAALPPIPAVFVDTAGTCGGQSPCFTTIQDGVKHAMGSMSISTAFVIVFPGTYPESVDLSLMGSDVGGMPGDLFMIAGTSVDSIFSFLSSLTPSPTALVNPAAGAAFFNSVSPFPGSVTLGNFTVVSKDTHGVDLHTSDTLALIAVIANGNFADGLKLQTDGDADIEVFGSHADMNGAIGMDLNAGGQVFVGFPFFADTAPDSFGPTASAMVNQMQGALSKVMAPLGITSVPVTTVSPLLQVSASSNQSIGIQVVAGSGAIVEGATANKNGSFGFHVDSKDSAVFFFDSANENMGSGFRASSSDESVVFLGVTALTNNPGDGITVGGGDSVAVVASYIRNNSDDGIHILSVGPTPPDAANLVGGNIICSNGGAGLRLGDNIDLPATGNWWGAVSGPFHTTKNPSGTGNAVVDGSSGGGMGDVTFIPFIDTVTATLAGQARVGVPDPHSVQFSGGGGTVFLGSAFGLLVGGPGDPFGEAPFTVTTDNGVVTANRAATLIGTVGEETGPTIGAGINQSPGDLEFSLIAATPGLASITVSGPCGLSLGAPIVLHVIHLAVPALSSVALMVLAGLLICCGVRMVRRRVGTPSLR
jgi:hypothetical protein